ncbi:MAG TPA: RNA methyltransferase [Caulobacteraceae bacterium]|nr:RNA methyltransferase [Caulobacteraceae bacterium]
MRIVAIAAPDDPRIAAYREVRERDLAGRKDGFIAEGEVVLRVLLSPGARCKPKSLLIAENRLARLEPLIAELDTAIPVYAASQAVMNAIVGFPIHRGMLALGERPPDPGAGVLLAGLPPRALVMVLFGVANHDNMGGLFRNAAAFGVDAVLLDPRSCDPLYRKAIRVSVGATLRAPFARLAEGEDALALLEGAGFTPLALSPSGAEPVAAVVRPARAAVLFGAEGPGLPPDLLARARTLAIPMAAGWDSLNVAAASAIVLHKLTSDEAWR